MEYEKTIEQLTARVDAVLDYIEQNPESDPNAYEMMDLTIQVANVGYKVKSDGEVRGLDKSHGYEYAIHHEALTNLRRKYFSMMDKRLGDMADDKNGLGLNEDSMLYRFLSKSRDDMITYNPLTADGDIQKREAKCKLAGVALYTKQRKRDLQRDGKAEVIYDNSVEFQQLQAYYREHKPSLYEAGLLDEIERCYGRKFEPKQTGIQGLDGLVKSDEEVAQSYGTENTSTPTDRGVDAKDIQ